MAVPMVKPNLIDFSRVKTKLTNIFRVKPVDVPKDNSKHKGDIEGSLEGGTLIIRKGISL